MNPTAAVLFTGGEASRAEDLVGLSADALVIAADSGAVHAVELGWRVDHLVGDFDSIPPGLLRQLAESGTTMQRHPVTKDQTDLALALDVALRSGVKRVTVVGGHGGRLDHLLANVLLLAAEDYSSLQIDARMGAARVTIVRGRRSISGTAGDVVSLLALGGSARGVTTSALLYRLHNATLSAGTSWAVSNEMTGNEAWIEVGDGVVAVVQPGLRGPLLELSRTTQS